MSELDHRKKLATNWFMELRDDICSQFQIIERNCGSSATFTQKKWERDAGGGGEMSIMRSSIFEKVGVNISTVMANFLKNLQKKYLDVKPEIMNFGQVEFHW